VAAKIFQIIGVVAVVIFVPVFILLLRFLGKSLKKVNKSFGTRRSEMRKNLSSTLSGLDDAQTQIEALSATTDNVREGMRAASGAADRFLAFVKSNTFQRGVPVALWTVLAVAGITRGLTPVKPKKKKKKPTPIPPPSWELENEKK
jgi:ABC-type multidrug transport system fused ATPase/permease subunit